MGLYCMESLANRRLENEISEREFYDKFLSKYENEDIDDIIVACDLDDNEFLVECIYGSDLKVLNNNSDGYNEIKRYFDAVQFFISIGIIKFDENTLRVYINTEKLRKFKDDVNKESEKSVGSAYTKKGLK